MPKIKLTKSELKSQRDSLRQFSRFLPTLQLKKQQLQLEMRRCQDEIDKLHEEMKRSSDSVARWSALFADSNAAQKISGLLKLIAVRTETHNIAGVDFPAFVSADFDVSPYDLFSEEPWIDDAILSVKTLLEQKLREKILRRQHECINTELRTTTQRVNLFEKIKIPQSKENIRVIQIYLGDQDTAGVARAKIAKSKLGEIA